MAPSSDVKIPAGAVKWALGVLQTALLAAVSYTVSWVWTAQERITALESAVEQAEERLDDAETELATVRRHEIEIQVLKSDIRYIREGVDDLRDYFKRK